MIKKIVFTITGLALLLLCSQQAISSTDCNYFSASVKVGKPYTKLSSSVKEVTFYWAGVNVTINGNGQLVSTSSNKSVKSTYDNNRKRYTSFFYNGHRVSLTYANNGSIYSISRSSANTIIFNYNQYGYLTSLSYRSGVMRFYYNNDGSLKTISQAPPVQCVYATFDGTL